MKAAFFDITGTLVKEESIRKYIHFLAEHHVLTQVTLLKLLQTEREHKKHHLTELQTSHRLIHQIANGLKGYPVKKFEKESRIFAKRAESLYYPYTRRLVRRFKEKNYKLIAISGAFQEVVEPFAKNLGFDAVFGSKIKRKKGIYTGRLVLDLTQPEQKRKTLLAVAKAHHIDLKESFCFGDMLVDVEMMEQVGKPVALNAGPGLKRTCKKNGWKSLDSQQVDTYFRIE